MNSFDVWLIQGLTVVIVQDIFLKSSKYNILKKGVLGLDWENRHFEKVSMKNINFRRLISTSRMKSKVMLLQSACQKLRE